MSMLVLKDRLLSSPVMSLQTGGQLGFISESIIDPRRLYIVAFYCTGPRIDLDTAVIHTSDIREYGSLGLIIDSADKIMDPTDLPRLEEVVNFNFKLEGKLVVEDNGRKLGKVATYSVETTTFYIIKLHIRPGLLQSFNTTEILIDRSQIKSIDDKQIVVKQADVTVDEPIKSKLAIDNPFRKPKQQTNGAPIVRQQIQ